MKKTINKELFCGVFLTSFVPMMLCLISMRFWEMDFSVQPTFGGDNALGMILMKSIAQNGLRGLWINPYMGAPQASALVDTPFLDMSFGIEAYIISLFCKSPATIQYIIYIGSYLTVGLLSYLLVLRKISNNNVICILASIFLAILPYHFSRGMSHGTLSRYSVIAVAIFLCICANEEEYRFGAPKKYSKVGRICFWGACFFVGISNIYYVFGALLCLAVTILAKMIRHKRLNILWNEAVSIYLILFGVFVGLFPKIFYSIKHGPNQMAGVRAPQETEVYALKIIQMLLPCAYNRIGIFRKIYEKYTTGGYNINENQMASLGLMATIGFVCICVWIILRLARNDLNYSADARIDRKDFFSLLVLSIVLYSVGGGFGTVVAYVITPEIRCLNRLSVFVAYLSICMLAIIFERALNSNMNVKTKKLTILFGLLLSVVTLYSEIPIENSGWQNSSMSKNEIMTSFFCEVQSELEDGDMVYQLPYMDFPEVSTPGTMFDYEPGYAYVYTNNLRWSYGAMKGRHTEAADLLRDEGISKEFVKKIKKAGFKAVYIDTAGYEDSGQSVIQFYSSKLGLKPIISNDGRLYLYKL